MSTRNEHISEPEMPGNNTRRLRSTGAGEIISMKPGFIINWGMYVMLLVFIALLILSARWKFNDTLQLDPVLLNVKADNRLLYLSGNMTGKTAKAVKAGQGVSILVENNGKQQYLIGTIQHIFPDSVNGTVHNIVVALTGKSANDPRLDKETIKKITVKTKEYSLTERLFSATLPSLERD